MKLQKSTQAEERVSSQDPAPGSWGMPRLTGDFFFCLNVQKRSFVWNLT